MTLIRDFSKIIEDSSAILIVGHKFPDTDSIGSSLALAHLLQQQKKNVCVWIPKETVAEQTFLDFSDFVVNDFPEGFLFDTCIVCDCSSLERVENFEKLRDALHPYITINLDHHADNSFFGDVNIVEYVSSVGEQIFYICEALGWEIFEAVATCLYAAISFDTGRFAHSNVTEKTLYAASKLVACGASPFELTQIMDENKTLNDFQLMKLAIENLVVHKDKSFAYTTIPKNSPHGTLKVIDVIRQLRDIDLFVVFQELQGKLVKVNLRSKYHSDVSEIAQLFGGGGHKRAAGILFKTDLESCQLELTQYLKSR